MLFQLVSELCGRIDNLPVFPDSPDLARQIGKAAPDSVKEMIRGSKAQGKRLSEDEALKTLSFLAHTSIRSIPRSARAIVEKVRNRRLDAPHCCAMAGILAYLVQPHDLIPDNAPGHYGFLDDAILLQAGLVEYLDTLPNGDADGQAALARFLIALTPRNVRSEIELGVASQSQLVQLLAMLAPDVAEGYLEMIIANPLVQPQNPSAPAGFSMRPPRDYRGGFFGRSGAYVEGNNVIMPGGGGGLLNGQLFIPS